MGRTLLRILLSAGLFAGFAAGGIVATNIVAGDEQQVPELDVSAGTPAVSEVEGSNAPGGTHIPIDATGDAGGGGSGGGSGSGGGDPGSAPDSAPADPDPVDPDPGADPNAPADEPVAPGAEPGVAEGEASRPPVLQLEGIRRWLDACADAAGEAAQNCPLGEPATILGLDQTTQFEITEVEHGPQAWLRGGCASTGNDFGADPPAQLVVWTTHPARSVVVRGRAVQTRRNIADEATYSRSLGPRRTEWEAQFDAGEPALSPACVAFADPGPGAYPLHITATSALADADPPVSAELDYTLRIDRGGEMRRPPVKFTADYVDFSTSDGGLSRLTIAAPVNSRSPGAYVHAIVGPTDTSCAAAEEGAVHGDDGLFFEDFGDQIDEREYPGWIKYYTATTIDEQGGKLLEEGQRYTVCLWWAENTGVVLAREQRTITMPDLVRYRLSIDYAEFEPGASGHAAWELSVQPPFSYCEATIIPPPGLRVRELVQYTPEIPLCDTGARLADLYLGVTVDLSLHGAVILVPQDFDEATRNGEVGAVWVDLFETPRGGGERLGRARIVWRAYDVPPAPNAPPAYASDVRETPGEDFTTAGLLLDASLIENDSTDPLRPAAVATLAVDRPVTGQVTAITEERGCDREQAALPGGAPPYTVRIPGLCPKAHYRFVARFDDAAAPDGSPATTYYALDARDWPTGEDATYRIWPGAALHTLGVAVDFEITATVIETDARDVFFDGVTVRIGRVDLAGAELGCRGLTEPQSLTITGLAPRALVPVEVEVTASTHPRCGNDSRGHVASIRGRIDVPLLDLISGAVQELTIPGRGDADARVLVRFERVTVVGAVSDRPAPVPFPPPVP